MKKAFVLASLLLMLFVVSSCAVGKTIPLGGNSSLDLTVDLYATSTLTRINEVNLKPYILAKASVTIPFNGSIKANLASEGKIVPYEKAIISLDANLLWQLTDTFSIKFGACEVFPYDSFNLSNAIPYLTVRLSIL